MVVGGSWMGSRGWTRCPPLPLPSTGRRPTARRILSPCRPHRGLPPSPPHYRRAWHGLCPSREARSALSFFFHLFLVLERRGAAQTRTLVLVSLLRGWGRSQALARPLAAGFGCVRAGLDSFGARKCLERPGPGPVATCTMVLV